MKSLYGERRSQISWVGFLGPQLTLFVMSVGEEGRAPSSFSNVDWLLKTPSPCYARVLQRNVAAFVPEHDNTASFTTPGGTSQTLIRLCEIWCSSWLRLPTGD